MEKYFLNINGNQEGPFSKHQVISGAYHDSTMVYSKSIGKWINLGELRHQNQSQAHGQTFNRQANSSYQSSTVIPSQKVDTNPTFTNHKNIYDDILDNSFPKNYSLATWGERFGARILDVLIMVPIVILPSVLIGFMFGRNGEGIMYLFMVIGMWLYFAIQESGKNEATWGKKILKIKVINQNDLSRINFGKASVRFLMKEILFSIIPLLSLINFLFPLWDKKNQTLHDKTVNTIVVKQ